MFICCGDEIWQALTALAECLSGQLTIDNAHETIGAAANRLATYAEARFSASSDVQRTVSEKIFRTEAARLFRCVHLCPPNGAFGELCCYLGVKLISAAPKNAIVDPNPHAALRSFFTVEVRTLWKDRHSQTIDKLLN